MCGTVVFERRQKQTNANAACCICKQLANMLAKEIEQIALFINFMESLILAQDERWRRA